MRERHDEHPVDLTLDVDPRQVDHLLDLRHGSPVAQIEAALAACGQTVRVELVGQATAE